MKFPTRATWVSLVKYQDLNAGEIVGHARSGHAYTCPVAALVCRVLHLWAHQAPPDTRLCTVYLSPWQLAYVTSKHLTATIRSSALCHPHLGILAQDVSAHALWAGSAMALLCGHVDTDVIKLVGRWRSDEMLKYLHLQAYPVMM